MILIHSIYDIISLYTHFIAIDFIYKGISGYIIYPIGVVLSLSIERILKIITTNSSFVPFKRPDGACNCNILNSGGIVDTASGFPSGHVASTSVYMTLLFFDSNNEKNVYFFLIYHIPTLLMGIARYMKKCHNLLQICAGFIIGVMVAYALYYHFKIAQHKIKRISSLKHKESKEIIKE